MCHTTSHTLSVVLSSCMLCVFSDVPVESMRLRFALLQSLNNTLESFFLPLVELRQTHTYQNSIAALLCEAKGKRDVTREGGIMGPSRCDCISVWTFYCKPALLKHKFLIRGHHLHSITGFLRWLQV